MGIAQPYRDLRELHGMPKDFQGDSIHNSNPASAPQMEHARSHPEAIVRRVVATLAPWKGPALAVVGIASWLALSFLAGV